MAAEYSAITSQIIQPGEAALFPIVSTTDTSGLIFPNLNTGVVRLASPSALGYRVLRRCCRGVLRALYKASFHGNVAIPEGGTAGEAISLAISIDGQTDRASVMTTTPAAVGQIENVGTSLVVPVPAICHCAAVSVRNISTQPIELVNGVFNLTPAEVG